MISRGSPDSSISPGGRAEAGTALSRADPLVGTTIESRYRVLSVLGEGGFGVVYKVEFLLFEDASPFAMKVLHPELTRNEGFRRRFLREARLALSLAHENVIQVREFGQTEEGLLYFTMDFCEGRSLKEILAEEGVLSVPRALGLTRQILRVLVASHDRGIIHRDLKPGNIFLEQDRSGRDRVKVGDFGLAKSIHERFPVKEQDITQGGIVGSPRYMSPEQAAGREIDGRSDLFSLGMILYETLYGVVPTERQLEGSKDGQLAPLVDSPRQHIPRDVLEILRRALVVDRESRYQSAEEFLGAIERLSYFQTGGASVLPDFLRWKLRGFGRMLLVSMVAVAFYAGSSFFFQGALGQRLTGGLIRSMGGEPPEDVESRLYRQLSDEEVAELRAISAPEEAPAAESEPVGAESPELTVADEVAHYFPLEIGKTYSYRVFREGQYGSEVWIRWQVVAEPSTGRFLVQSLPDGPPFYWVHDPEENTISREFRVPDPGTGELSEVERRILLKLPRDPSLSRLDFTNHVAGQTSTVTVQPEPGPVTLHGETFTAVLKVEEEEKEEIDGELTTVRTIVRYYQKWVGEVGYQVLDNLRQKRLVYSRVLQRDDKD